LKNSAPGDDLKGKSLAEEVEGKEGRGGKRNAAREVGGGKRRKVEINEGKLEGSERTKGKGGTCWGGGFHRKKWVGEGGVRELGDYEGGEEGGWWADGRRESR